MLIRLEPIALAHAAAVQALASDARIADTSNVPHPYPADGAVTWIRYTMALRDQEREVNFAMIDATGILVGVCGVLNIERSPKRGELGYWVGVPYWGRGYASAAARELVRLVFEEHGIQSLYSSCLVRNPASRRVLEKAGFRHVGYGTHPHSKWGPADRFALFELTREEWADATGKHDKTTNNKTTNNKTTRGPFGIGDD
jgi:[ribosomal protein S5]-alanine N-acetyltransferase